MLASPLEQDTKVGITDLTHASVEGNGVFDVLMRAVNAHLQKEWSANRLKGTEYSTVYLGALESTMNASLQFLLARDKTNAELDILKQQLVNLKVEEINAGKQGILLDKQATDLDAATALKVQQRLNAIDELLTASQQRTNLASENLGIISRTAISNQQLLNLQVEKDNAIKQGLQLTAQTLLVGKQELQVIAETLNIPKQGALIDAQKDVQDQQKLNLEAQKLNIPKEGALVDAQRALTDQKLLTEQDALLTATAQRFVLMAQANGFNADAKQKAAEILLKGFSVVATTNDLTEIQSANYGVSTTKVKAALDALVP